MSHYLPQLTSPSDCPSNLKEAIDWILRVTGKDGQGGGNGTKDLAGAVEKLLKDVKASSPELGKTFEQIKKALRSGSSNGLIDALGDGLNKFKEGIQNIPHYKSAYNEQSNWDSVFTGDTSVSNDGKAPPKVAAKIFLGCVPMIFYGLSYLYWRCSDKGGWKKMMLNDGDGSALKNFMEATGFDTKSISTRARVVRILLRSSKTSIVSRRPLAFPTLPTPSPNF
ncbi:variant erythrocyte surface antigen-1 family protein [Babesia caballi]|uniref:Variant erythrocyte surface antigen-1 family protein n=1 Tax=Babesia caballi TaxID=5871 RepID=A0AAV4LMW5_BABCB|nr:variant erythrocyte surface antigen-1 family protein [Babesia caballi]